MSKFIVTLEGYDIKTATPEQCAIHSDYPLMKIEEGKFGTFSYTFSSNPAGTVNLLTVPHGYSYRPAHLGMVEYEVDKWRNIPAYLYSTDLGAGWIVIYPVFEMHTDSTNFYIDYSNTETGLFNATGKTFNFKYWIFVEDGV